MYWKYNNVVLGENDEVILGTGNKAKKITFEEGYWTFTTIKERLDLDSVKLEATTYNNKCRILSSGGDLNLAKFGPLLGFQENEIISGGVLKTSTNVVDVNQGLRYINIECDIINSSEKCNSSEDKSYTLASLPVTSEQRLNGSVTFYKSVNNEVIISDGYYNGLVFDVNSDINKDVNVDVLLELYVV